MGTIRSPHRWYVAKNQSDREQDQASEMREEKVGGEGLTWIFFFVKN